MRHCSTAQSRPPALATRGVTPEGASLRLPVARASPSDHEDGQEWWARAIGRALLVAALFGHEHVVTQLLESSLWDPSLLEVTDIQCGLSEQPHARTPLDHPLHRSARLP